VNSRREVDFPYSVIDSFKKSKATTSNNVIKLRIVGIQGNTADIAFEGPSCESTFTRTLDIIKAAQKEFMSRSELSAIEPPPLPASSHLPSDYRREILTENVSVAKIYRSLVSTWIVTDDEFWETFKLEIAVHNASKPEQSRYSPTNEEKLRLFQKDPRARSMFNKYVAEHPSSDYTEGISPRDEEEFWRQYFTNPHFMPTFSGFEMPKLDDHALMDSISRSSARTEESRGFFNADAMPRDFLSAVQSVNRQSELALIAAESPQDIDQILPDETEVPKRAPFFIVDPSAALQSPPGDLGRFAVEFAQLIDEYAIGFNSVPKAPEISDEDSKEVLEAMTDDGSGGYDCPTGDPLVEMGLERLRKHKLEQQILLFHFWNNMASGNEADRAKAQRLRDKLKELRDILVTEKRGITSALVGKAVAPLYDEMNEAFVKAFAAFDQ
jgi:hypothetical protein